MCIRDSFKLVLCSVPIYTLIVFAFMKPFERMNHDVMQSNAMVNSAIIEDINGIETIKSLTSEEDVYKRQVSLIFSHTNTTHPKEGKMNKHF